MLKENPPKCINLSPIQAASVLSYGLSLYCDSNWDLVTAPLPWSFVPKSNNSVCDSLRQQSLTFLAPGTRFVKDSYSTDRREQVGMVLWWNCFTSSDRRQSSGVNASLPTLLPFCCAAWFLTGYGLVPVLGPGVGVPCPGEPCPKRFIIYCWFS